MSEGLGLGSAGFVERHGLYSDEQAQAAVEVVARIEELGLRTVRLVLVDQHGVPRSKHLSGEGAIAAMRSGADFSGAIFSLDTGNRVFPPLFVQGGGFGIDEFTGFPDVVIVPDPTTFRVLPWADRTGWMICDVYFGSGRPLPLDGRAQLRAQLARLREMGYGYVAGLEVELFITRLARSEIRLDETGEGQPGPAPEVEVFQRGYQFLSDARLDGIGETLEAIRDGLWDVGLPPRSIEDEWGPGQIEFKRADGGPRHGGRDDPLPQRGEGDLPAAWAPRVVHVLAGAPELLPLRLAPAPVARRSRDRLERVRLRHRPPDCARAPVRRRPARVGSGDGGVRRPDRERVRAVPTLLVRARPGRLGGRQPGRADPRPGRAGRSRHARREPPWRTCREPVPLARREHRRGPRRDCARRRAPADRHGRPLRRRGKAAAAVARRGGRGPRGERRLPSSVR